MEEAARTAQEFRPLRPLPWLRGLCPPGGGQKNSLYILGVYSAVTMGTISSPVGFRPTHFSTIVAVNKGVPGMTGTKTSRLCMVLYS